MIVFAASVDVRCELLGLVSPDCGMRRQQSCGGRCHHAFQHGGHPPACHYRIREHPHRRLLLRPPTRAARRWCSCSTISFCGMPSSVTDQKNEDGQRSPERKCPGSPTHPCIPASAPCADFKLLQVGSFSWTDNDIRQITGNQAIWIRPQIRTAAAGCGRAVTAQTSRALYRYATGH